jgi:hypothetical protein
MQRRHLTSVTAAGLGFAIGWPWAYAFSLNQADASVGVRAALERGALSAIGLLGRTDGYLGNALVRIALPGSLNDGARVLRALGQQRRVDELVTAMNRAAELAVPQAQDLLVSTVRNLSVQDAVRIVQGGETSVTDFFSARTRAPLSERFLPIVTHATEQVSLAEKYNAVAGKAVGLGLVKKEDANIQSYVTRKALDGLFLMIGEEEKKIRRDPISTGSDILRKVFGR